jgi:Raf kinase inhibitor-like YbhB/YbcL family protein
MTQLLARGLCMLTIAMPIVAQAPPATLAKDVVSASTAATIVVTSPSVASGQAIPLAHADYGEKTSPALQWKGVPATARSLVLLMEDPDAREPKPFVHWILFNLPATVTDLREALPPTPRLPQLDGALQGRNSRGSIGYFGPRPPKGDPPHHYHFQLFALDAALSLDPGATRAQILEAMKGHVVASGSLVGTFAAPPTAK